MYFNPEEGKELPQRNEVQEAISNQNFELCLFKDSRDNAPKPMSTNWVKFCTVFSKHEPRPYKDGKAWSPVSYNKGTTRSNKNVDQIFFAVIDVDNGTPLDTVMEKFSGYALLAHSSYSHTKEKQKYRVIIPLERPVKSKDWTPVWERINLMAGECNDPATKDSARLYFTPSHPMRSEDHFVKTQDGRFLSVDDLPALPAQVQPKVKEACSKDNNRNHEIEGIESSDPELGPEKGLNEVATRCEFMKFASAPENQPDIEEPLWMAMISNACRFENSAGWIHEASKHYPGYSEDETNKKISHALIGSNPITCHRIAELGFKGCPEGGCKLPRGNITKAPAGLGVWFQSERQEEEVFFGKYRIDRHHVSIEKESDDGSTYYQNIASRIFPVALTRNENQQDWGVLLEITDPAGKIHEWVMPLQMLSGNGETYREQLLILGARIYSTKELGYFLMEAQPKNTLLCAKSIGWHGEKYVLPERTFGRSDERVILQSANASKKSPFSTKGSLEEWQSNVAAKCIGNSRLVLATCIALASPFLEPLEEENGGFHFRGGSSTGKTKTLFVAASVWGGKDFIHVWRTTGNAIESLALEHNDNLLILDELGQVSPQDAGDIAYTLGNGQQKARANRFGDLRNIASWRLLFISTGEIGLADHVAQGGKQIRGGQEIRMLDIPADAGKGMGVFEDLHGIETPGIFADTIEDLSRKFHGTAGVSLLEHLTSSPETLEGAVKIVREIQKSFIERNVPVDSHGQIFRAAARFGLVAAVGEFCIEIGILPWPEGEAYKGAQQCFQGWLHERGGNQASEEIRALSQVREVLERYSESRFSISNSEGIETSDSPLRTNDRLGFRESNGQGFDYCILPQAYKSVLCEGFDPKLVTKVLLKQGVLAQDSKGNPQVTKRIPGIEKTTRVYIIKGTIFDYGDEEVEKETA